MLAVHTGFEAKTLQQYVDISRPKVANIVFGSPGLGTYGYLLGELFKSLAGVRMLHIPYKGGGPAVADLVAGHIPSAFFTLGVAAQHLRTGKVRALALRKTRAKLPFPIANRMRLYMVRMIVNRP